MSTNAVRAQITELRWLVYELGQELDTLATTPYPLVHRFLMCTLTTRIALVAVQVERHLSQQPPDMKESSDELRLLEQSA
jgi:hypothetical protein